MTFDYGNYIAAAWLFSFAVFFTLSLLGSWRNVSLFVVPETSTGKLLLWLAVGLSFAGSLAYMALGTRILGTPIHVWSSLSFLCLLWSRGAHLLFCKYARES